MASPSISGLSGSGIDFSGIVTQLVAVARQPINALSTKKFSVDSAISTLDAYTTQLTTLQTAAKGLSETSSFISLGATSTDPAVVASTTGGGSPGQYSITVNSLARAEKRRSDVQSSSGDALGKAGTLGLKIGSGAQVDVEVKATDSLGDIATKINASGARTSASVLYDGSSYRLVLQGLDTGAANGVNVSENGFSLGLSSPSSVYQSAADASLVVDGMAVTRPTNSVSGVIEGVTLALTKTTSSPATLTVASDTTALQKKIEDFVSAYNVVVNSTQKVTGYGSNKATNPLLAGDSAMRKTLDRLSNIATSSVPNSKGAYTTLASVGISLSSDGQMKFDTAKLKDAISKDASAVQRLFVTDTKTGATGAMKSIASTIEELAVGPSSLLKSRRAAFDTQNKSIDESIEQKTKRLESYEKNLKAQYANVDKVMSRYQALGNAVAAMDKNNSKD